MKITKSSRYDPNIQENVMFLAKVSYSPIVFGGSLTYEAAAIQKEFFSCFFFFV
jgi:hypothetical protein